MVLVNTLTTTLCVPTGGLLAVGMLSLIDMLLVVLAMCAICQVVFMIRGHNRSKAVAGFLRCGVCGYNLTGHEAVIGEPWARCPECGEPLQEADIVGEGQLHPEELRRSVRKTNLVSGTLCLISIAISLVMLISRGESGLKVFVLAMVATFLLVSLAVAYWRQRGRR